MATVGVKELIVNLLHQFATPSSARLSKSTESHKGPRRCRPRLALSRAIYISEIVQDKHRCLQNGS